MTTAFSQAVHATETIAVLSGTLAVGNFINSGTAGAINNIPVAGTLVSYDLMDVFINLGTAAILGSSPSVAITTIDSPDGGTTFVSPGTAALNPAGLATTTSVPQAPSSAAQVVMLPDIPIRPYDFLTLIQNNTGVTWPTGTVITAVRKSIQNW